MTNVINPTLIYSVDQDGNRMYFLHVITSTQNMCYYASGSRVASSLSSDGKLLVELFIDEKPRVPDFNVGHSVVHVVDLGSLSFGSGEVILKIEVIFPTGAPENNDITSATIGTADAIEDTKPVEMA